MVLRQTGHVRYLATQSGEEEPPFLFFSADAMVISQGIVSATTRMVRDFLSRYPGSIRDKEKIF